MTIAAVLNREVDWHIECGDCLEVMTGMAESSVDTIITDPPYGLTDGPTKYLGEGGRGGFMGKAWDHGVPGVPFWQAALRVAKPGAMLLAFGGTRTHHRLMCAIEDVGWKIRDCMMWMTGQGFPKSASISKNLDKAAGAEREVVGISNKKAAGFIRRGRTDEEVFSGVNVQRIPETITAPATDAAKLWHGWGTALKPAWEPIILAMKPLDGTFAQNAQKWGVAGLWIDGGRIGTNEHIGRQCGIHGWQKYTKGFTQSGELITQSHPKGRWPANVILDPEAAAMLDEQSGLQKTGRVASHSDEGMWGSGADVDYADVESSGGASRFFYCAKASKTERNRGCEGLEVNDRPGILKMRQNGGLDGKITAPRQNNHPTVKPLALMRYLCRLTRMPTGGIVLDPFAGSGSTCVAALLEGRAAIGIDTEQKYVDIARCRMEWAETGRSSTIGDKDAVKKK